MCEQHSPSHKSKGVWCKQIWASEEHCMMVRMDDFGDDFYEWYEHDDDDECWGWW